MLDCSKIKHLSIAIIAVILNLESGSSLAQIVPDRTLGDESSVVAPNVEVKGETADRIDGGAIRDRNLFHSFTELNVEQGQRVYFANPNNIERIFTRVTGSNPSNINGSLGVDGAADLLLLNPNGIIFGENSSLDLEGSFFGTSADGILFEDETEFDAVESNSTLLTISVPVGLQVGNNPGSIVVRSPFTLANGRDFSLVGGEVNLTGNDINIDEDGANSAADGIIAPGGRVQLAGLATEGIVSFDNDSNLVLPENVSRADISLNNYFINASAGGGGSISLQSKNLRLIDSLIISGINSNVESTDAQAGDITIDTSDTTILRANENSASIILNVTGENITGDISEFELSTDNSAAINVSGNAGNISIDTNSLSATGFFLISSLTNGEGNAGNISINAVNSIALDLSNPIDIELQESTALAAIASFVGELGTGNGANISINAGSLSFNNTVISTSTAGAGNAGNTSIEVDGAITANNSIVTADSVAAGDGGNIRIDGRSLSTETTRISTSTAGTGNAGNTSIDATDSISFKNTEVVAETFSAGDAGNIVFESQTASISLEEDSAISTTVAPLIEELVGTGRGGNITIYGRYFSATNSLVASATGGIVTGEGLADAGDLTLSISDSITISNSSLFFTNTVGEGNAGDLFVKTRNLNLFEGGQILASSSGIGNSGTINIEADEIEITGTEINLIDNEEVTFPSGISATTENSSDGGIINITARNLSIADGAVISVRSLGDGNAGSIFTQIDNSLELNDATFSSRSDRSSGGEIEITADDIRLRGNSNIQTNVENGAGGGGNITLTADSIVTFDDSDIFAFATDGVGGNITLDTDAFFAANYNPAAFDANPQLLDNNNRVDLNASGSVFGIVDTPEVNFLPNSLAELSEDRIDTKEIVANSCAVRTGGGGTFIVTGSGGLPSRPGDAAVVDYATGTVRSISDRRSVVTEKNWQPGDPIIEPEKIYRLSNGKLVLSRECS